MCVNALYTNLLNYANNVKAASDVLVYIHKLLQVCLDSWVVYVNVYKKLFDAGHSDVHVTA